ncbi:MAG: 1-acyl-sn-glycerol-3-phosphate acyltransferase [Roseburia sp.]|nr:1-acyl-sn-glycerol-3-phosphate acyltransferase [Anaeroplasma bactoclasticum]MCM1195854.1 1-acyl-sn-glycerol-3-phosphate acyltransferase [Roseburia sp.]MCM1556558.1 1-acyl-sn-glycerol-3-phosphate acyltransferase [Anaeroplasma bactoclasticum]
MTRTIYYSDEINDEFSGIHRKAIPINEKYKYERSALWRIFSFILYNLIMKPIAYVYMKLRFSFKIENRKVLKKYKKGGYFLYANHTNVPADGFMPTLVCFPKRVYVLVSSENLSLKGTRNFMAMIGAVPIPNTLHGMKGFKSYIHKLISKGSVVMIYPEAHIWPYYTKIRPFGSVSFTYPVLENAPIYTFTVTYHKGWIRTKIIAYVDGPFYSNSSLKTKESIEDLRNQAYSAMQKRSELSTYEKINYIKKESELE